MGHVDKVGECVEEFAFFCINHEICNRAEF